MVFLNFMCISYFATQVKITCTSTAEAEAAGLVETAKCVLSCRKFLEELGFTQKRTQMYTDNMAAKLILSATHPSRKSRHWRVRAEFLRELCEDGVIQIHQMDGKVLLPDCGTKHNISDFRTIARRVCSMEPPIAQAGFTNANVNFAMSTSSHQCTYTEKHCRSSLLPDGTDWGNKASVTKETDTPTKNYFSCLSNCATTSHPQRISAPELRNATTHSSYVTRRGGEIMKRHSPCSLGGFPGSGATSTSDSEPVSRVRLENEQPSTDQHCATVAVEPLQTVQDAQPSSGVEKDTTTTPALLMAS